jgi:signal transduction histidine kinase
MLAERCTTPVSLEVAGDERYPEAVEIAAYFLVSEALTNVARHAAAAQAKLIVRRVDATLVVDVIDDGQGGADRRSGSGLRVLEDRIRALGGGLMVDSPPGRGTVIRAQIPCV